MRNEVQEGVVVQHIGVHGDDPGALLRENAAFVKNCDRSIRHGLHTVGIVENNAITGTLAKSDYTGERNGDNNRKRCCDQQDHQGSVDGDGKAEVCQDRQSDRIDYGQKHGKAQDRSGAGFHDVLNRHAAVFIIGSDFTHVRNDVFIVILQIIQCGFLGVILRIIQQERTDLIEKDQSSALDGKADEKRKDCNQNDHDGRICEAAIFDRINCFQNDIVSGQRCGQHQKQDRKETRQLGDQRSSENDGGDHESDDQKAA